jgi:SET domain-containing protein
MPTYFHFHTPNSHFDGQLETHRCSYTHNNKRCKNRVCIGLEYCFIHTRLKLHLKVQKSNIHQAGVGLFAFDNTKEPNEIVFRRDTKICDYNGEIIDEEELNERYGNKTATYTVQINNTGRYEDGAVHRGIGTLINSPSGTRHKPNCRFSIGQDHYAHIVALKNIKNGEELFLSYGRQYKFHEENVETATNHRKYNI